MLEKIEPEKLLLVNGSAVKQIRISAKLSQVDFADRVGWSQQNQSKLEKSQKHCIPEATWHLIVKISEAGQ